MDMEEEEESQAKKIVPQPNLAKNLQSLSQMSVDTPSTQVMPGTTQDSTTLAHSSTMEDNIITTSTLPRTVTSLRRKASFPSAGLSTPPKILKIQSAVLSEEEEKNDYALPPLPESPPEASLQPFENRISNSQLLEGSNSLQDPFENLPDVLGSILQMEEPNIAIKEEVSTACRVSMSTGEEDVGIMPSNDQSNIFRFGSFQPSRESTPIHVESPSRRDTNVLGITSEQSLDSPQATASSSTLSSPEHNSSLEDPSASDGEQVITQTARWGEQSMVSEGSTGASGSLMRQSMDLSSVRNRKLEKQHKVNEWLWSSKFDRWRDNQSQPSHLETFQHAGKHSTSLQKKWLQCNAEYKKLLDDCVEQNKKITDQLATINYQSKRDSTSSDSSSSTTDSTSTDWSPSSEGDSRFWQRTGPSSIILLSPSATSTSAHDDNPRPLLGKRSAEESVDECQRPD